MKEQGRNMLIQNSAKTLATEIQGRLASVKAAAAVPEACGPAIAPAPARGGFVLVQNIELIPVGADESRPSIAAMAGGRPSAAPMPSTRCWLPPPAASSPRP